MAAQHTPSLTAARNGSADRRPGKLIRWVEGAVAELAVNAVAPASDSAAPAKRAAEIVTRARGHGVVQTLDGDRRRAVYRRAVSERTEPR